MLNIVFASSYSSQLGFLVACNYARIIQPKKFSSGQSFFVFILPCASDMKLRFRAPIKSAVKKIFARQSCSVLTFPLASLFSRLAALPLFFLLYFISFFVDVKLWQPRPNWARDIFRINKSFPSLFLFDFQTIFYGDGFLNNIQTPEPFWLRSDTPSKFQNVTSNISFRFLDSLFRSSKPSSFYLFDVTGDIPDFAQKIPYEFVHEFLKDFLLTKYDLSLYASLSQGFPTFPAQSRFFVFPTTTFFETGRSTLTGEINMYKDFLAEFDLLDFDFIVVKPHPGSSRLKNELLVKTLSNQLDDSKVVLVDPYSFSKNFPLSHVPLEILIFFLLYRGAAMENIFLVTASTAAISIKTLFPTVSLLPAFGRRLIDKHLFPEYRVGRLKQESILLPFISL